MHILWIKTELLHPVDKGGRIRTYQMLRELRRHHRVTYLTLDDGTASADAVARATEYCHEVIRVPFRTASKRTPRFWLELAGNLFSGLPYAVAKYRVPALAEALRERVSRGDVDVVLCDFLSPSVNVPRDLGVPTVLFQHNVEAAIWERHTQVAAGALRKAYMGEQWRRMRRWEGAECRRFDQVIAVSAEDCRLLESAYGLEDVSEVPTGVDTEFFRPSGNVERRPHELVFTGSMDWLPNEDGVIWFCDEILPLIRREIPETTLSIVGRTPSRPVLELAERHAGVEVTGSVPDVRPHMERAAVFVIPLRIGGGTRLKVYEAMGMEVPIVSTTVGAEGLPVRDGEELLLADEPEAFASAVVRLLRDEDAGRRLATRAADRVRREFGWSEVAVRFAALCERVASGRAREPALVDT
jgi:sugar transferase (PEP-CTERM/EpsH1 system associated)